MRPIPGLIFKEMDYSPRHPLAGKELGRVCNHDRYAKVKSHQNLLSLRQDDFTIKRNL